MTTAQLVLRGDVGGLYYIGTAEAMRGQGLGGLITVVAVNEAARIGCGIVSLQASPLGKPVYEKLGFRTVAEYATYVPA